MQKSRLVQDEKSLLSEQLNSLGEISDMFSLEEATIKCPLREKKHYKGRIQISDSSQDKQQNDPQTKRRKRKRPRLPQVRLSLKEIKEMEKILSERYYKLDEIAHHFNIHKTQIGRYIFLFKKTGGKLYDYYVKARSNNPQKDLEIMAKKQKDISEALNQIITKAPKLYQREIKHILQEDYGIVISQTKVSRCLRKMLVTKKKPQKSYVESNTESNLKHRQQYCSIFLQLKSKCIFLDQCGINNRIRREKGWVRKGESFYCQQPSDGTNKYSLLAAISFERLLQYQLKVGACSSTDMVRFILQKLSDKYLDYVLILDNARIHKTPEVRQALAQCNMRYLYLPPYSPVLNPIECVFHEFKAAIRDIRSENPDQSLKDAIERALLRISARSFANYERKVRMWAEKGLRFQKF